MLLCCIYWYYRFFTTNYTIIVSDLFHIGFSDIVVTAVGKAGMFKAIDFSQDTTIIDVSINFDEAGKICGDVKKSDYDER